MRREPGDGEDGAQSPRSSAGTVEGLVRGHLDAACRAGSGRQAASRWRVDSWSTWLIVLPDGFPLPDHGWKLHLSSREATFTNLVQAVLPLLLAEGCPFKLARSPQIVSELNDGRTSPASVGKAITVYPDQRRLPDFGFELARMLHGHEGPRVLSDRQVHPSAPVYYRYGPFRAGSRSPDEHGRMRSILDGPDGDWFDADATLRYRQPSWAADPFARQSAGTSAGGQASGASADPDRLGDRYRVTGGIREAAQGNIYRGIDESDGSAVVIKQARAFVAEHGGIDTRMRLRNERRILNELAGTSGVPRFIDHFQQGTDEFLVTADCGPVTLAQDVMANGPYRCEAGAGSRRADSLAARLAGIVHAIHDHGVIMRDLSPRNVVLDGEDITVVDFGLSAHDGLHMAGGTPGYAPVRQFRDEPPCEADDLHALGMTLLYAVTGLDPVTLGRDDEDLARTRALQAIYARTGPRPAGIWAAIAALLGDGDQARAALIRLTGTAPTGDGSAHASDAKVLTRQPVKVTRELCAEIVASLRADLLSEVEQRLATPAGNLGPHDVNVYDGTSGIGLELLHHCDDKAVRDLVAELVRYTASAARSARLPPGLFNGVMGVRVLMSEARFRGIDAATGPPDIAPPSPHRAPDWNVIGTDLIEGAAGLGLGHLCLFRADGDRAHLDAARNCARVIDEGIAVDPAAVVAVDHFDWDIGRTGVDPSAGAAHGLAGIVELYLALAERTGERADLDAAAIQCQALAERAPSLMLMAGRPSARPLAGSWCQGLAGVGRTLLHGSTVLCDPALGVLASRSADACMDLLQRMPALGQCCGVAGVGNLLIDLAVSEREERYWSAADRIADHLLLRSAGSPEHPVFTEASPGRCDPAWASGIAGILAFFRRLAGRGGPDSLPLWEVAAERRAGGHSPGGHTGS